MSDIEQIRYFEIRSCFRFLAFQSPRRPFELSRISKMLEFTEFWNLRPRIPTRSSQVRKIVESQSFKCQDSGSSWSKIRHRGYEISSECQSLPSRAHDQRAFLHAIRGGAITSRSQGEMHFDARILDYHPVAREASVSAQKAARALYTGRSYSSSR